MRSFPYLSDVSTLIFGADIPLPIPTFGLFVALAIGAATAVAMAGFRRQEARGELASSMHRIVPDLALVCCIAGIIGARIFYIADHFDDFARAPAAMIFSRAGFSIYGGLAFGFAAGIVFLRRRALDVRPVLDAVAPALMLGYGIGRLGCQVAGDGDWGIAANLSLKPGWLPDWAWAQTYEGNILGVVLPNPGVYPTPLFEFAAATALFLVLFSMRDLRFGTGLLFSIYLLFAGFERLLIEKIRINVEYDVLGHMLTQAEMISVAVIGVGLVGVMLTLDRRKLLLKALVGIGTLTALSACVPW